MQRGLWQGRRDHPGWMPGAWRPVRSGQIPPASVSCSLPWGPQKPSWPGLAWQATESCNGHGLSMPSAASCSPAVVADNASWGCPGGNWRLTEGGGGGVAVPERGSWPTKSLGNTMGLLGMVHLPICMERTRNLILVLWGL